jgi:hypothetical protein
MKSIVVVTPLRTSSRATPGITTCESWLGPAHRFDHGGDLRRRIHVPGKSGGSRRPRPSRAPMSGSSYSNARPYVFLSPGTGGDFRAPDERGTFAGERGELFGFFRSTTGGDSGSPAWFGGRTAGSREAARTSRKSPLPGRDIADQDVGRVDAESAPAVSHSSTNPQRSSIPDGWSTTKASPEPLEDANERAGARERSVSAKRRAAARRAAAGERHRPRHDGKRMRPPPVG